jgi:hypothetical protein
MDLGHEPLADLVADATEDGNSATPAPGARGSYNRGPPRFRPLRWLEAKHLRSCP